jgi:hypothetical protein
MSDEPSLLAATAGTFVGNQVILLGLLMLSIGVLVGVNIIAQPAAAEHYSPMFGYTNMPWYLDRAAFISRAAAGTAAVSTAGLVYLDYTHD